MKFTLTIDCSNAAFGETPQDAADEINRILSWLQPRIADGLYCAPGGKVVLRDTNGNTVGAAKFEAAQ